MTFQLTIKSAVPTVEIIRADTLESATKKASWLVKAMYNNAKRIPAFDVRLIEEAPQA